MLRYNIQPGRRYRLSSLVYLRGQTSVGLFQRHFRVFYFSIEKPLL